MKKLKELKEKIKPHLPMIAAVAGAAVGVIGIAVACYYKYKLDEYQDEHQGGVIEYNPDTMIRMESPALLEAVREGGKTLHHWIGNDQREWFICSERGETEDEVEEEFEANRQGG